LPFKMQISATLFFYSASLSTPGSKAKRLLEQVI
jgi:hypothetical protein